MSAASSLRRALLAAGASALVMASIQAARADQSSSVQVNLGIGQASTATTSETVIVKEQKRLLKEKNSPSAVTELGTAQIAAAGVSASTGSLLRQAPSVYVYQQGIGDNAPELTIRGVRGLEIASTLDGVPTQDLLAPNFYLSNNIGGVFTNSQISGVSIYPGVAYPDKSTFGTIGGTVAYDSLRPTADRFLDLIGSVGSYGTDIFGFQANSGAIDSPLGTGDNALRLLLNYRNLQTQGYVDGTPNRENEMEFAFDKPYDDGLSKFQGTVIYNTANGLIENEPVPLPYLNQNGFFSNYPTNLDFAREENDFLTIYFKDDTYVNDYLSVGATVFYKGDDQQLETYGSPTLFLPAPPTGYAIGPLTVGGASPFINNPAGFGEGDFLYGPPTPPPYGIFGGGYGGYFYGIGNTYNPFKLYPAGSPGCPNYLVNEFGGRANAPCGLNDQVTGSHSDTYGVQPRATIIAPEIFGIANTIKIGGLFAKETSPTGYTYLGAFPGSNNSSANLAGVQAGGVQRSIYVGYIQDKIDLLENTLHITPGATAEGSYASLVNPYEFGSHAAGAYGPNGLFSVGGTDIDQYGPYKGEKWDREYLPFINVNYDFDKILPPLKGLSVYGSFGNSAVFAPVGDFGPNTAGNAPNASIVHMYEAGAKYNISNLVISADYFYQNVDRDFGFFSFQSGPQQGLTEYGSNGQRVFKGEEASVTWQVTPQIQLFANASHLTATYPISQFALDTVAEDQYGIAKGGTNQTGIPDWLSTFGVEYDRKSTFMDDDVVHVRLTGTYTGHQYTSYDYGGNDYLNQSLQFNGLEPLNYSGCPGTGGNGSCLAYARYNQITGATTTDPNGGINPFVVFGLDASYTLPTPYLPALKKITFDTNIVNLFDQRFFQYYYKQISPAACGFFTSGPFVGLQKNNYSCTPEFADGIPGQPFSVFFTVTARF
jgi:iron complex outermembrane receptor protein